MERRVGIGLVGPRRVRPDSGVWASVSSRPLPPTRLAALCLAVARLTDGRLAVLFRLAAGAAFREEAPLARRFTLPARAGFAAFFFAALPFAVRVPAAFRLAPFLAAAARFPAPLRVPEGVFCPLVLPLFLAIGVSLFRWSVACPG